MNDNAAQFFTVAETVNYANKAERLGMSEDERDAVTMTLSTHPLAGDMIVGSGGCRKVRVAGRGKGKSGGYRVITYFVDSLGTVYLLTVFSKGDRANLSRAEVNGLAETAKASARSGEVAGSNQ